MRLISSESNRNERQSQQSVREFQIYTQWAKAITESSFEENDYKYNTSAFFHGFEDDLYSDTEYYILIKYSATLVPIPEVESILSFGVAAEAISPVR